MKIRMLGVIALVFAGLVAALPSCHASSAVGAATVTSLAIGTSGYRRANGECYTDCLPGTFCNRSTGLCDALGCSGKCEEGFVCQETGSGSGCVPRDPNAFASRGQSVPSGAQPFGSGVAQQPSGQAVVSTGQPASGANAAKDPVAPGIAADGGVAAPAAAVFGASSSTRTRSKDEPVDHSIPTPWIDPADPSAAPPSPQMSNPNLPPPH